MKQGPPRNSFEIASCDQTAFDLDFQGRISFNDAISIRLEMGRGAVDEKAAPPVRFPGGGKVQARDLVRLVRGECTRSFIGQYEICRAKFEKSAIFFIFPAREKGMWNYGVQSFSRDWRAIAITGIVDR
jgi:hypothetical protein